MTARPALVALRALGLGDLLTGVPALRALRRHFPDHEIVLAAPARLRDAAEATGCVDRLLPTTAPGRQVPARLPWDEPPPDVAVDLHGNGPAGHRLLQALHPGRLLAFDPVEGRGPHWQAEEHERIRWCRLLHWYGIPTDPDDLLINPPGGPPPVPAAILLHPGADAGTRRWGAERFAAVARALAERGAPVVVTAGAGERPLALRVVELAGLPESVVHGGERDLPFCRLAALVRGARAVVAGDTGLAHLATALAVPSVTLFGPVSPDLWGPPPLPRHAVLWHPYPGDGHRPGDAHTDHPDPRLLRITVPEVLAALDALHAPARRHTGGDTGCLTA